MSTFFNTGFTKWTDRLKNTIFRKIDTATAGFEVITRHFELRSMILNFYKNYIIQLLIIFG